jgi:hypothetical protein
VEMVVGEGGGGRWLNLVIFMETTHVSSMIGRYWVVKWVGLEMGSSVKL